MKFFLILFIQTFAFTPIFGEVVKGSEKTPEKTAEPDENGDSFKHIDYSIDWKYKAGEYFIYDCKREYYACVDLDGYERCVEDRKTSISKNKAKYDCAPLKQFPDKRACIVFNYSIIERVATKKFCYPK